MRLAVIKIFILILTLNTQVVFSQNNAPNEEYKVKFSYDNYQNEREIIYKQLIQDEGEYFGDTPLFKEDLGIDLYDIDDDNELELLVFIHHQAYCGSAGCDFRVLKKFHKITCNNKIKCDCPYEAMAFGDKYNKGITTYGEIEIMKDKNQGFHDLKFYGYGRDEFFNRNLSKIVSTIWRWQGEYYE